MFLGIGIYRNRGNSTSVLWYLAGTVSVGAMFDGGGDINGYNDADWAGDLTKLIKRSTRGYIFKIGNGSFS